jgi:hypothetical protein
VTRSLVVAIAVAISLVFASLARAQTAEMDPVAEAKRLFREGNALRNAGDCEGALVLYLRSRAVVPSVPNLTNAAYCAQRVGRIDEALSLYEELTVRFAVELTPEDRAAIAPTMAELRKRVGLLDVTANVSGTVVVDGRPRGNLPLLAPIRVRAGSRRVQVLYEGWESFDTTVTVRPGETTNVDAKLKPLSRRGRLRVEASEPGVEVVLDGVNVGKTPWEGILAPGEHAVWLEGRDRGSAPISARVIEGRTSQLTLQTTEVGPRLTLVVQPRTAILSIDGVRIGSDRFSGRLPLGPHRIQADELGYRTITRTVRGEAGGSQVLALEVDEDHPRWRAAKRGLVFGTLRFGGAFALGTGSGAEASCETRDCKTQPAFGLVGAMHAGYELPSQLSFFVGVGVLAFSQNIERSIDDSYVPAAGAVPVATQYRLKDDLALTGPFLSLGLGQRFPLGGTWEIWTALQAGAVAFAARDAVSGTGAGGGVTREVSLAGSGDTKRSLDVFVQPEAFFSVEAGPARLFAGLSVAFFLLEGPALDTGDLTVKGGSCTSPTIDCAPGVDAAAGERSYGRFVALLPQLGARYDF